MLKTFNTQIHDWVTENIYSLLVSLFTWILKDRQWISSRSRIKRIDVCNYGSLYCFCRKKKLYDLNAILNIDAKFIPPIFSSFHQDLKNWPITDVHFLVACFPQSLKSTVLGPTVFSLLINVNTDIKTVGHSSIWK